MWNTKDKKNFLTQISEYVIPVKISFEMRSYSGEQYWLIKLSYIKKKS